MTNVLKDYAPDDFLAPEGVTFANIDPKTGRVSASTRSIKEVFITGTEPGAKAAESQVSQGDESQGARPKPSINLEEDNDEILREDQ
jgi:membrane carboxypeptidase/penicillin-binding protein